MVLDARWWWPWPACSASPKRCDKQSNERPTRGGGKVIWPPVFPRTEVVICSYQRQPMELDVALVVNSISDQCECAEHSLLELKASGMLLQSDHTRTRKASLL